MKCLKLGLVYLLICHGAYAAPTMQGPTGLIKVPSAEPLEFHKANIGIDYNLEKKSHIYKFNLGAIQNCEIGFSGGTTPTEGVFVNAKYFVMSNSERFALSVAIGVENLGAKDNTAVYMVSSKKFHGGWDGHFGFRATFDNEVNAAAMFGVQYMMDSRVEFLGDVIGENNQYTLNAGMRYDLEKNITLRLAMQDITKNAGETIMTMGLSFETFL